MIALSDYDDRFSLLCIQLIRPLCGKVILDDRIDTADQDHPISGDMETYGFLGGPRLGGGDCTTGAAGATGGDLVLLTGENWF